VLTFDRDGIVLHFDDDGFSETPWVYKPLLLNKVYEEHFLLTIREMAREGVYLDIGAHLGTHTVWFAAACPSTEVHAFEPIGRYADVVRRNVALNHLEGKVTVHQIGLSDHEGTAVNYMSPEHQFGFDESGSGVDETFPTRRLDDVVQTGRVAVMKLDVEGMEAAALRGATRILKRDKPVVFAEAHNAEVAAETLAVLAPFGYVATGRVFNPTPTYEYIVPPKPPRPTMKQRLRPAWRALPQPVRTFVRKFV
jgi:FkbM family methyltransferase